MHVAEIGLTNFRSYHEARFAFSPGLNIVVGENAAGKTNLLEGVFYALRAASPRTSRDEKLVRWGASYVRAEARLDDGSRTQVYFAPGSGRRIRVSRAGDATAEELRRRAAVFIFVPESLLLVKGSPARRRAHLDTFAAALDASYAAASTDLQLALRQRNAQLVRVRGGTAERTLDPWDKQVAQAGVDLGRRRRGFVEYLRPIFAEHAAALTPCGGTFDLELQSGFAEYEHDVQAYLAALRQRRALEIVRGTTSLGPHRDELRFLEVGGAGASPLGRDLRPFGSQGEQRAAVLALLLAERHVAAEVFDKTGPLLLDDVMSELDERRRRLLVELLLQCGQVLVTTTTTMYFTSGELARALVIDLNTPEGVV